ncbi:otolith matrix protein OMM-64-like [Aphis gossypii]|uniref:otolith matrix protein OMM-64-like n=1 Tax=Aphis gossypii TaxID=80765 RepID=UPI0021594EEF|nr:otolith matrix protein OMM-64-like [Aphis gossypii]
MMAKSLSIIFVSFIFSTSVSFGEDACSNFEDKDCVSPNILKNGHFINQWSVYLPGMTKSQAKQLLEENGFDYLGQIMDGIDLHLVTKKGTQEKHALPNERIIELLKKHEKVHSVAQKHVLENSQDQVVNIIDEDKVYFESIDPSTIVLNDGWNNLERITAFEAAEAARTAAASANTKSADANEANEADGGDNRKKKQRRKIQDGEEVLDEDALDENASDEESLDEDVTDEDALDEDALDEDALDEDALDEDALDEDALDEDALDEDALDEDALDEDALDEDSLEESR